MDAYQVIQVRSYPGAAGTVINNLVALGVKEVCAMSVIGDDGEGYEVLQALDQLRVVDRAGILQDSARRTPTYIKPMLQKAGQATRELNRLDIKNRAKLSTLAEEKVLNSLEQSWTRIDALIVSDQVSEADCGVITALVRKRLADLADADPSKVILADSRERIGQFRSLWLKPNRTECVRAILGSPGPQNDIVYCVRELARRAGRPVFCTQGERGIVVEDPRSHSSSAIEIPAYPVTGPIDIVGAGDSANAGIACALAAGADLEQAAAFGCLVASITIQQIGTTGTATPDQIRRRWQEVRRP